MYIFREDVLEKIRNLKTVEGCAVYDCDSVMDAIYDVPTVDVEKVVRCSECIYCENMKCTGAKDNSGHPLDVATFDYCSQGVRKEKE